MCFFHYLVNNMTEIPTHRTTRYGSSSSTLRKQPDYYLHFIKNPESETDMDNCSTSSSDENENKRKKNKTPFQNDKIVKNFIKQSKIRNKINCQNFNFNEKNGLIQKQTICIFFGKFLKSFLLEKSMTVNNFYDIVIVLIIGLFIDLHPVCYYKFIIWQNP